MSHPDTGHRQQHQRASPGLQHPEAGKIILGDVLQEAVDERDEGHRLHDFLGFRPERGALRVVTLCCPPEDRQHYEETNGQETRNQLIRLKSAELRVENADIDAESDGCGEKLGECQRPDIAQQQHEAVGERRQARALTLHLAIGAFEAFHRGNGDGGRRAEGRHVLFDCSHDTHAHLCPNATVGS